MTAAASGPATPLSPAETRRVIIGLFLGIFLGALDSTIVSIALPVIARELDGFSLIAWVVSGYLVAATVITPIYGKLGDLFGRRKLLSVAIGVFLVASLCCALAQTMPQLIAARVLQGLGGGGLISIAQATVADVVPLRERGRYVGYISGAYALASVAGPVIGGLFTHYLDWRWIFWINLPLGVAAFLVSRRALIRLPVPGIRRRIDYLGASLLVIGLTALLVAITRIGQGHLWNEPPELALFATALAVLALFFVHELRTPEPILPLGLFRIDVVAICCAVGFLTYFVMIALAALSPLWLQMTVGAPADQMALRLLPFTLAIPVGAFTAGRAMLVTGRFKPMLVIGTGLLPLAFLAMAVVAPADVGWTALAMGSVGLAVGITLPSGLVAVQNGVPREQIGVATAATTFSRSLGGAVGVAVFSALLVSAVGSGASLVGTAADSAFDRLFVFAALVSAVAFVLALRVPDKHLGPTVQR